jgi:hypothetical protein
LEGKGPNFNNVTVPITQTNRTNSRFILFFIENTQFVIKYRVYQNWRTKIIRWIHHLLGIIGKMFKKFTDLAILAIIGDVENKHDTHCIMNTVYYNFKNSNNKYKKMELQLLLT